MHTLTQKDLIYFNVFGSKFYCIQYIVYIQAGWFLMQIMYIIYAATQVAIGQITLN